MDSSEARARNEEFFLPAILCFGGGGSILISSLSQTSSLLDPSSLSAIIISAAVTAFGAGKSVHILLNDSIIEKLRYKIKSIYSNMGIDFEEAVKKEREKEKSCK